MAQEAGPGAGPASLRLLTWEVGMWPQHRLQGHGVGVCTAPGGVLTAASCREQPGTEVSALEQSWADGEGAGTASRRNGGGGAPSAEASGGSGLVISSGKS